MVKLAERKRNKQRRGNYLLQKHCVMITGNPLVLLSDDDLHSHIGRATVIAVATHLAL